jgi:hypothetical protein
MVIREAIESPNKSLPLHSHDKPILNHITDDDIIQSCLNGHSVQMLGLPAQEDALATVRDMTTLSLGSRDRRHSAYFRPFPTGSETVKLPCCLSHPDFKEERRITLCEKSFRMVLPVPPQTVSLPDLPFALHSNEQRRIKCLLT